MKLSKFLSKYEASLLDRRVFVPNRLAGRCHEIFLKIDDIFAAMDAHENLFFKLYQINIKKERVARHEGKIYEVCPVAVIYDNDWYYLVAHQIDEDKLKFYRIDRIGDIDRKPGSERLFSIYSRYDPEACKMEHFNMFGGKTAVITIGFHNSMAEVMFDRFGINVRVVSVNEEYSKIMVKVSLSEQFVGWVLGMGDKVKVLGPDSAVAKIRESLYKAVERYAAE